MRYRLTSESVATPPKSRAGYRSENKYNALAPSAPLFKVLNECLSAAQAHHCNTTTRLRPDQATLPRRIDGGQRSATRHRTRSAHQPLARHRAHYNTDW